MSYIYICHHRQVLRNAARARMRWPFWQISHDRILNAVGRRCQLICNISHADLSVLSQRRISYRATAARSSVIDILCSEDWP